MTPEEIKAKLQEPFDPSCIEWRVDRITQSNGKFYAHVLAYVQNRAIQNRLDDVFGPLGWQNKYRPWKQNDQLCGISVYDPTYGPEGQWITKWDGASDTHIESTKGGLSDSMKRAAVQWGIGRYLYKLDSPKLEMTDSGEHWVGKTKINKQEVAVNKCWNTPQLPSWALPEGYIYTSKPKAEPPATGQNNDSGNGNMTVEEAANMKMGFGKHKGKTLGDIYREAPDYVQWFLNNGSDPVVKKAFQMLCDAVKEAKEQKTKEEVAPGQTSGTGGGKTGPSDKEFAALVDGAIDESRFGLVCNDCGTEKDISPKEAVYCRTNGFDGTYCRKCQPKHRAKQVS